MRISQLLPIAIRAVVDYKRGASAWVSPLLQGLEANGRLTIMELAPTVEVTDINSGKRTLYLVEEVLIPITWTQFDEDQASTESKKIELTKSLVENAIDLHDDILLDKIGTGRAVASKNFHYYVGAVNETQPINPNDYMQFKCFLFTAVAFLPL